MSDRLDELHRQRASLQAHLDWLDREIIREQSKAPVTPPPHFPIGQASAVETPMRAKTPLSAPVVPDSDAESILAQFADSPQKIQTEVKRGCWTVFALALLIPALAIAAWYWLRTR